MLGAVTFTSTYICGWQIVALFVSVLQPAFVGGAYVKHTSNGCLPQAQTCHVLMACGCCCRAEHIGAEGKYESSSYFFDMTPRPWDAPTEGAAHSAEASQRCTQEKDREAK
jgi:hypothetical protein